MRAHRKNFLFSLESRLYRPHCKSMNGRQMHQILTIWLLMCGVQCCRHFTNLT